MVGGIFPINRSCQMVGDWQTCVTGDIFGGGGSVLGVDVKVF